jgi:hypothetical protein
MAPWEDRRMIATLLLVLVAPADPALFDATTGYRIAA